MSGLPSHTGAAGDSGTGLASGALPRSPSDWSEEDLERVYKAARQQAEAIETSAGRQVDWRLLGYVVLGGILLTLVLLQLLT